MPAYDYRCKACHQTFTLRYGSYAEVDESRARCPKCQSIELSRLIRRVGIMGSEERHFERLSDPSRLGALDEDDPRAMGRFMREMASEMGEPLDAELGQVVERLESGESPESIEQSMDLPGDNGGGDFDASSSAP